MSDNPDPNKASKRWQPPSDQEIAQLAAIDPNQIADAVQHLRRAHPDLTTKWGLGRERPRRTPKQSR